MIFLDMNSRGVSTGYLLTFDFRLEENKRKKAEWITIDGKQIFDFIV